MVKSLIGAEVLGLRSRVAMVAIVSLGPGSICEL